MRRAITPAVIVVLVLVGGVFAYRRMKAPRPGSLTQYKLGTVDEGTVKKTVSATGTLQAWSVVDIKSKAGGRVDALLVDEGSVVKKGQVLAKIDPSDTQLSLNTAVADQDSAVAKTSQSEKQWRLQVGSSTNSLESAKAVLAAQRQNLAAALARLEKARSTEKSQPALWRSSVAAAQASLNTATHERRQLDATQAEDRASAQSTYDQAVANRVNAEAALKRQQALLKRGFVAAQAVDTAKASYEVSAAQVRSADERVKRLPAEQRAVVDAADAKVAQTRAQLETARTQKVEVETAHQDTLDAMASVKQLNAQVHQQQLAVEQAQRDFANNSIKQDDIAVNRASIKRAKASVINAQSTLAQTIVRSPTDGVVLTKYVEQGTIISSALSFAATGNNILQLGDITRMYVDVAVDETDVASVSLNQNVEVSVDAYPNIPFEGKVIKVSPQAVVANNVTTIHARVEVDNSAAMFRLLKPGMNATCEFVVDRKDNVLYVPTDAIRTDDSGEFVEVASGGDPAPPDPKTGTPADPGTLVNVKLERRPVNVNVTALEGNDSVEVVNGLKKGEKIVVQTIEPTVESAGSPFGMGRPPGGRSSGGGGGGRRG